ncbi:MAG: TraR/DksA C4-type zinc finger protein [Sphingomonas sp.]
MPLVEGNPDLADKLIEAERDHGIHVAQAALAGDGEAFCVDCGLLIPRARHLAMPSAKRCITCQIAVERGDV